MISRISIENFLNKADLIPVVDVRSPGEFNNGHIPGAQNIPVFNDEERARVGTMYKKSGRDAAVYMGFEIVGPKMKKLVSDAKSIAKNNELLIHCWRGGMRSANMAWLFSNIGIRCHVLIDGYKSYRRYIKEKLADKAEIFILSGMTGSGKTDILHKLNEMGEQILDLEQLSHHKGSAFGSLGQLPQLPNEQFENNIFNDWKYLDINRRIWIEDESHCIGTNYIPDELFSQMRNSAVIRIDIDKAIRIQRLVKEYACFEKELLEHSIRKIYRRLGGQHAEKAFICLENNDFETVSDIVLTYYDKAYLHGLSSRDSKLIHELKIFEYDHDKIAESLINFANKIKKMEEYKLTQFSPGAGCGCKISPKDLEAILKSEFQTIEDTNLLVGNASKDDAAVYQIDENNAIISTTDFFTPIVDNPFDFGRIAATNAISDIYAMGGKPIMAIAILGWPLVKLPKETAQIVINGARHICREAGISISGGHSIDISDPIFGLAVTGQIHPANIKQNNMAKAGCSLFLTKALGVGIITTAEKRGIVKNEHIAHAIKLMTTLNKVGYEYSKIPGVTAMTDITGFGLLGHLIEMCEGSNLHAVIEFDKLPLIDGIKEYIKQKAIPGGTFRNWKSYSEKIGMISEEQKMILCDPQTSGGLLVAVEDNSLTEFMEISSKNNSDVTKIGVLKQASEKQQIIIIQ